jgi:hypothetical protein
MRFSNAARKVCRCRGPCGSRLLFGGQLRPVAGLSLQPLPQVVAFEEDAGLDLGEEAVGFVGGEVAQYGVVALPVQWPGAVP